jgi:hypothetical protein
MSRTESQRNASRQNGRLSVGPVTPRGRMAASRNSSKHGFSGSGRCLPPEMAVEVAAEVAVFAAKHNPQDDYERDLIRRAALGTVRSRRLYDVLNAETDERARTAVKRWDEARADEVAALAARLDDDPEVAVRLLGRTAEGCDHLGDAWEALGRVLQVAGHWDEAHARRALRLLGIAETPTPHGDANLAELWRCVLALQFERNPEPLMRGAFRGCSDPEAIRRHLPEVAEAREALAAFVRDRVAEYESLGQELWENFDAPARESAVLRAAFDPGPESARLARYLADAERLRRHSLDELARLRRDAWRTPAPAAPRNEPAPPPTPAPPAPRSAPPNEPEVAPRNEPKAPAVAAVPAMPVNAPRSPLGPLCPAPSRVETLAISIARPS